MRGYFSTCENSMIAGLDFSNPEGRDWSSDKRPSCYHCSEPCDSTFEHEERIYCGYICAAMEAGRDCMCCGCKELVNQQGFCDDCAGRCECCDRIITERYYTVDVFEHRGNRQLLPMCRECMTEGAS